MIAKASYELQKNIIMTEIEDRRIHSLILFCLECNSGEYI